MSRTLRPGALALVGLLVSAGVVAALVAAKQALTSELVARAERELGITLTDPRLELRPAPRELQLLAALSWQRSAAAFEVPRAVISFPLGAWIPRSRDFAPLRLEVSGARFALSPRALVRAAGELETLWVQNLAGRFERVASGAEVDLELAGQLASGGHLRLRGTLAEGNAPAALDLELQGVELGALWPALTALQEVAGQASGPCELGLAGTSLREVSCRLSLSNARLRAGDLGVAGTLQLDLELAFPHGASDRAAVRALSGHFEIDARAASLSFAGLTRPPGQPAVVRGEVLRTPEGPRLEYALHFENLETLPRGE